MEVDHQEVPHSPAVPKPSNDIVEQEEKQIEDKKELEDVADILAPTDPLDHIISSDQLNSMEVDQQEAPPLSIVPIPSNEIVQQKEKELDKEKQLAEDKPSEEFTGTMVPTEPYFPVEEDLTGKTNDATVQSVANDHDREHKESSLPPVTHALEALLGGLDPPEPIETEHSNVELKIDAKEGEALPENTTLGVAVEEEHPEWEIDSSPIESSSDDSSSDDSSSESDEEGDNSYKLLSPEEQARILMEGDGGSDDEGANKGMKGSGGQLRTKNEVPEEIVPKPDVNITAEMPIQELGTVEAIVENILLIKAKISGEYRVLESGSVLCLFDRSVIGIVSETLGRVQQPLYSVRFTNAGEITEAGLAVGTKVYYSEIHSTYVFTQSLKAYKGSDASNLHDEEVGDDEMEFSDDEAEMEHKRKLKQRKLEKRGGRVQQNGGSNHGGHPLQQQQHIPSKGSMGLNYDDAEDDGPYKPLSRPVGFADTVGRAEAPQEGSHFGGDNLSGYADRNGDFRGRGRGGRGRGDRARGGDRGRGRGGYQGDSNGYSLSPQSRPSGQYAQPFPGSFTQPPSHSPQQTAFPQLPQNTANNYYRSPNEEYSPRQPQLWPQFPAGQTFPPASQQHYSSMQQATQQPYSNMPNNWSNMPQPFQLPSGAFINPAFFAGNQNGVSNLWNQQGQPSQPRHSGGGGSKSP